MRMIALLVVITATLSACCQSNVRDAVPTEPVVIEKLVPTRPVIDDKYFVVPDDPYDARYPYPLDTVGGAVASSRVYRHWFFVLRDRIRDIEKAVKDEP